MYLRECPEPKLAEALWLLYKYMTTRSSENFQKTNVECKCSDSYLGGNCIVFCVEPIGTMLLSLDGAVVFFFFFGGPLYTMNNN